MIEGVSKREHRTHTHVAGLVARVWGFVAGAWCFMPSRTVVTMGPRRPRIKLFISGLVLDLLSEVLREEEAVWIVRIHIRWHSGEMK